MSAMMLGLFVFTLCSHIHNCTWPGLSFFSSHTRHCSYCSI